MTVRPGQLWVYVVRPDDAREDHNVIVLINAVDSRTKKVRGVDIKTNKDMWWGLSISHLIFVANHRLLSDA